NSSPLWEDFIIKATKLHACLRAAIQAISSYLEAFQKIADAATNSKGASKEIGTALTRVCLRHKAVETRMKTFTTAIMDSLIIPLQDKLEEWKRQVVILDKDHTKEYKRCRNELKKRSSDTLRLQKKAKKGTSDNLQSLVDSSMQTVNQQKAELDEVERKSLRSAMIEDRTRYCQFVNMLQPVVKQEYEMMYELGHLQEAMQTVSNVTKDPTALPQASEELIAESKTSYNLYPDSPTHSSSQGCSNSLGSRKSSVCSISSMNSSGSSGSPGHQFQRSLSQVSTVTNQSHAVSTWPPPGAQEAVSNADRPHTISTAYERGHQRPALTVYTFQNPGDNITESTSQKSPAASLSCRPPLPIRCSSLERPLSTTTAPRNANVNNANARQCPSPIPAHVTKEHPTLNQPTYVNMTELASMAAYKNTNSSNNNNNIITTTTTASTTQSFAQSNSPALSSTSSLVSPDSSATNPISSPEGSQTPQNTPLTNSPLMIQSVDAPTTNVDDSNHDDLSTPTNQAPVVNVNDNNSKFTCETLQTRDSPPIDVKSLGSVLDKASMFEKKLEEQHPQTSAPTHHPITLPINNTLNLTPATVARLESIYGKKTEEIYNKTAGLLLDRDRVDAEALDPIDTVELDNLIGELDQFQKEHEAKERERQSKHTTNGHCEHQTPIAIKSLQSQTIHNDSIMSTSTTITHAFSDPDKNDKVSLSASLNFSITSNASMTANTTLSDLQKFNCSDSEKYWNDNNNDLSADTGFENPSFVHLNDTNIVVMRDNDFPTDYYAKNSAEIVVLRCKDTTKLNGNGSNNNSITDLNAIDSIAADQKQRLSSFRAENNNVSYTSSTNSSPNHYFNTNNINNNSIPGLVKSVSNSFASLMYGQVDEPSVNVNNNVNVVSSNKPAITPRPASLLSGVSRIARRSSVNTVKPPPPVRRSSSVTPSHHGDANNPQNNLMQHQQLNVSSESLPPPPAYLLDRNHQHHVTTNANSHYMTSSTSMGQMSTTNGTSKTHNDIRHSPGVMRRQLSLISNHHPSNHSQNSHSITYSSQPSTPKLEKEGNSSMFSIYGATTGNGQTYTSGDIFGTMPRQVKSQQGIYAQPKQVASVSSFRTSSPNPPPKSAGLLAQLTARITPNKSSNQQQQQQQQQQQSQQNDNERSRNEPIYQRRGSNQSNPYYDTQNIYGQQQKQQQQQQHQNDDYQTGNYGDKTESSVLAKTSPGFLDNLNQKLAEQRASNKAFQVRSYINSKVVPDPRIVRESLMDQIKRGANLKQTRDD
ncbi:CLUMA_CG011600, isoform B, partial [Clunio marinus]